MRTSSRKWESPTDLAILITLVIVRRANFERRRTYAFCCWGSHSPRCSSVSSVVRRLSNQPRLHPPQEILPLGLGPRQRGRLIPILQRHFLQKQLHRIFRLESLRYQLPNPRRKTLLVLNLPQPRPMIRALMLAKLGRRQPVIRRARVRIAQQSRQRIVPLALRASPSLKCMV